MKIMRLMIHNCIRYQLFKTARESQFIKPIPVQFIPNISRCVYVYIVINWTQEDTPWLVRKGEVWGVPCNFIICRKRFIFSLRITEARVSSFWWGLRHWLHRGLSKCQFPVQPGVGILSECRRFCLEVIIILYTTAKYPEHYIIITMLIKSDLENNATWSRKTHW